MKDLPRKVAKPRAATDVLLSRVERSGVFIQADKPGLVAHRDGRPAGSWREFHLGADITLVNSDVTPFCRSDCVSCPVIAHQLSLSICLDRCQ
jgi:hypothetical protein